MKQETKDLQQALHLSDYEARVYIAVLESWNSSVTDLSAAINIPRTAVYPPIVSLLKRGLLSKVTIGKRVKYQAVSPDTLLSLHDRERLMLKGVVEGLARTISLPDRGMSVRYFPGLGGLSQAADIFLETSETKLWKTVENADHMAFRYGEGSFDAYIERRVHKKIFSRTIIPADPTSAWMRKTLASDEAQLRKTVIVSPRMYPIEASFAVCGQTVMLLNAHGVPSGTLIKNEAIARTFESMHDMIWDRFVS